MYLTKNNFVENVKNGISFIKLSSPTCGPCKNYKASFNEFSTKNPKIKCFEVDASKELEIAGSFGIRSVPVTIILVDGKEVNRRNGVLTVQTLEALIP